jgi:hypothetical protein
MGFLMLLDRADLMLRLSGYICLGIKAVVI